VGWGGGLGGGGNVRGGGKIVKKCLATTNSNCMGSPTPGIDMKQIETYSGEKKTSLAIHTGLFLNFPAKP